MKKIMLAGALFTAIGMTAQVSPNVIKESTTTTVTVNDGSGQPKKATKTQTSTSKEEIQLKDADSKKLNKDATYSTQQVSSSTVIQGDGIPTYYQLNGERYIFVTDKSGYKIASPKDRNFATVRKTSDGHYLFRTKTGTAVGYFDADKNFVVESYDDKADGVTVETYSKVQNP